MKNRILYFFSFILKLYKRCAEHRVRRMAAEIAYYMLFTLFPFVIFIYSVLALLELPIEAMLTGVGSVLPADVYDLITDYLIYIGGMSKRFMLYAGSVLAVYMLFRAITSLNYSVRKAFHRTVLKGYTRIIVSVLTSSIIMLSIFTLFLMFSISRNAYHYIALFFRLSSWVKLCANIIRYAAGPVFVLFALCVYYYVMDDREHPIKKYIIGAGFTVVMWYAFSVGFMYYTNHYGKYTNLYGSLASIMVLMIWFHTNAAAVITGAEINAVLNKTK